MKLISLSIDGVRNLKQQAIHAKSGINFFLGDNGAGKTSILEAIHVLGTGRSFRGAQRPEWINIELKKATLFSQFADQNGEQKLGFERSPAEWRGRFNGQDIKAMSQLARCFIVCAFHPQSHLLIEGEPQQRRQFLDYVLFHVEPRFYDAWRQYKRVLNQRNQAIKTGRSINEISIWTKQLSHFGETITDLRSMALEQIITHFNDYLLDMAQALSDVKLKFYQGWNEDSSLSEILDHNISKDRERGFTGSGPHRADIRITDGQGKVANRLSRGQQKTIALAMCFSQCLVFKQKTGEQPVLLLDDLASELDSIHQQAVIRFLEQTQSQTWITGTSKPDWWDPENEQNQMFHVEQGSIRSMV